MEIKCGMIVRSVAGHDKDRFYLVVEIKDNRIYIADGKIRKLSSLKGKNPIHLKITKSIVDVKEYGTDRKIRKLLHSFNYD